MRVRNYADITIGLKEGDALSAYDVLKAVYGALQVAACRQDVSQTIRSYFENTRSLMQCLQESLESGAILLVSGSDALPRHANPTQELHEYCDRLFSEKSMDQHWQDKGKAFCEDVAKNICEREAGDEVKGVEEGIQKAKQERAILERKAAAFDEIAGEMASVYQAVHALDGSFDTDNDRNNVPYATMRAMFSLGVVAEIINKTKEDVVNAE